MAASALNNVIDLSERRALSAAESSRMLNDCRELAMRRLSGSLREMLSDIEEELFRMAEASYDREMQNLYLEARGMAREKWPQMEAAFSRHFVDVFNHRVRGEMGAAMKTLGATTQELRLVEEDDLAESLAMQALATRLREQNEHELALLGERVALLMGRNELKDEDNPVSPQTVCDALRRACDEIESNVKIKLVLLKQIEQHVSGALQSVYADLNSEMVRWNVLPDLRTAYRKPVHSSSPSKASRPLTPPAEAQAGGGNGDLMSVLNHLVLVQAGLPQGGAGMGLPHAVAGGGVAQLTERRNALIDSLTEMQRLQSLMDEKGRVDGLPDLGHALGTLNALHRVKASGMAQGIGQLDAITIDIVAMLFDFIFDDAKIPEAIKALVGRLQIPVLKVAMLDPSFFASRSHPARRLLDGISQAAMGWGDKVDPGDALYQELAYIVGRIQSEFDRDAQIFADALNLLHAAIAQRDALAEEIASRSAEVMRRRETEEIAWIVAGEAVSRRLAANVPQGVRRFLRDHWQYALKELYLRHGEEHHAYLSAVAMMDDLIWSVAPKKNSDERRQLVNTLPGLLRALQAGLDAIGLPQEKRKRFFDELVEMHSAAVKAGLGGMQAVAEEATQEKASPTDPSPADRYSVNPDGELLVTRISENDVQIEEVSLVGTRPDAGMAQDVFQLQVAALARGDWVEFRQEAAEPMRARLSWISPQRGIFLFTNPRSPRATAVSREALAYQLRSGSARVVSEAPLFERAVNGVLNSLQLT